MQPAGVGADVERLADRDLPSWQRGALRRQPVVVELLRPFRFHSAATWLIASGESSKVVMQRLGHSHVSVTLQLYSHVMPAHDRVAANALAAAGGRQGRR